MARKNSRKTEREQSPEPSSDRVPDHSFRWNWAISFLLLLSITPGNFVQPVRVLPAVTTATLAPEWTWDPPLVTSSAIQAIAEWPCWLYAAVMSLLIAWFLIQRSASGNQWIRFGLLIALSVLVNPADLPAAAILVGMSALLTQPRFQRTPKQSVIILVIAVVASVAVCLDFSIVIFVVLCRWLMHTSELVSRRQQVAVCGATVLACGLAALWSAGFAAALARPLTWLMVPEQLLPMSLFADKQIYEWVLLVIAAGLIGYSWWNVCNAKSQHPARVVALTLFTLLAFTCQYYSWISLLGAACVTDYSTYSTVQIEKLPHKRRTRPQLYAAFLIIPFLSPLVWDLKILALSGRLPADSVDPAQWGTSGRVMLMRPEFSSRWQTGKLSGTYELLVSDRWDLFQNQYRHYQQVCRDLSEVRSSRYLRTDGTWGGYKQWTTLWKPTLLAVDSSDLDSIRRLSLSPHWKVMGIDGHRTILGAEDEPKNVEQYQEAGRLLSELEWPSPQYDGSFGDVIEAYSPGHRMQVARVLLAMRLPYAAQRVMPVETGDEGLLLAMCQFEVAHRVFRHTRVHSLLDQYRAIRTLRRLARGQELSNQELLRLARGLEELDEAAAAVDFADQLLSQSEPNSPQHQEALELKQRCELPLTERPESAVETPEERLRVALRSGDAVNVTSILKELIGQHHQFFQVLVDSVTKSPEDSYRQLIELLNHADFPASLRSESLFYLGSLAIEVGDSPSAANAFSASIQADPSQPLNAISRISLMNLRKPGR